jgi:hypothetical protein
VPLAGPRCAVLSGPWLRLFSFVSGWRAFSSVSLCKFIFLQSFGRLGAPALSLLRSLVDHAVQAGGPGLSRDAFVLGALRELGTAMCRGNASLVRSGLYALTRVSGRTPLRGLSCPSAEVV